MRLFLSLCVSSALVSKPEGLGWIQPAWATLCARFVPLSVPGGINDIKNTHGPWFSVAVMKEHVIMEGKYTKSCRSLKV